MNLFSYKSLLSKFLYLVADIMILHLLWLICSIPIITIGASSTALYYACMKRIRTDEGYITTNFFKSFKQNFRQSTIIWFIIICVFGLLFIDISISLQIDGFLGKILLFTSGFLIIPTTIISIYIFPVQAKFDNSIFNNFKNAIFMSISALPFTIVLIAIFLTFLILTLSFVPFIGLMIICGAGLYGYLVSSVFVQIFRKFLPEEQEQDIQKTDINNIQ